MTLGTFFYTFFFGNLVGQDDYKNKYYCNSKNFLDLTSKRWVIYNGEIEASKVPSHWHAWLHKTIDIPPIDYNHKYNWQKKHEQNHTGTINAYYPSTHPLSKQKNKKKIENEYEKWQPQNPFF